MSESGYVHKDFVLNLEKPKDKIFISHSQFALYKKCPHHWKLKYIDKIKEPNPSIHTVFGTAMHRVIQEWIQILYLETVKKSDEYDVRAKLLEYIKEEYRIAYEQNNNVMFTTKEELSEFYVDGLDILLWLRKKRKNFFDRKYEELIGIELPLFYEVDGVILIAYLDAVFRDKSTGKIIIRDFKTSKSGWNDYTKKDEVKISQLILYKIYFAKQFNIPVDQIDIEYMILKRKVNTDLAYPIPRVSSYVPSNGSVTQKKVTRMFEDFINDCFIGGKYNSEKQYIANAGWNGFNCKFCEFMTNEELCPQKNRITE